MTTLAPLVTKKVNVGEVETSKFLKFDCEVFSHYQQPDETIEFSETYVYVGKAKRLDPKPGDSEIFARAKSFVKFLQDNDLATVNEEGKLETTVKRKTLFGRLYLNASISELELLQKFGGKAKTLNNKKCDETITDGYNHLYLLWVLVKDTKKKSVHVELSTSRPKYAPNSNLFSFTVNNFHKGSAVRIAGAPGTLTTDIEVARALTSAIELLKAEVDIIDGDEAAAVAKELILYLKEYVTDEDRKAIFKR